MRCVTCNDEIFFKRKGTKYCSKPCRPKKSSKRDVERAFNRETVEFIEFNILRESIGLDVVTRKEYKANYV